MDSCPCGDLRTLPTATQLTQPVTTCVRSLVSYAGLVERMPWLTRKSHRSSAPSNEQERNGARPNHSPGGVVPHAGAAEAGPREGGAETAGPLGPPGPRDTAKDSGPQDTGPQDTGSEDTGPEDAGPRDTDTQGTGPGDAGPQDGPHRRAAERHAGRRGEHRLPGGGVPERVARHRRPAVGARPGRAPAVPRRSRCVQLRTPGRRTAAGHGAGRPLRTPGRADLGAAPPLPPAAAEAPAPGRSSFPQPPHPATAVPADPTASGPAAGDGSQERPFGTNRGPETRERETRERETRKPGRADQRARRSRARHEGTAIFRSGGSRSPRAATRRAIPAHTQLARSARRVPAARAQART